MDLTPEQLKEHIYKFSGTPVLWRHKADELRHAAIILQLEIEKWFKEVNKNVEQTQAGEKTELILQPYVGSIHNMLLGFCIENLLKGIILQKDPSHLVDGKLSKEIKEHKLRVLARIAEFELSYKEIQFCDVATEAMITSGRYPIATKASEQRNIHNLCDKDVFEVLFQKLRKNIFWHLENHH